MSCRELRIPLSTIRYPLPGTPDTPENTPLSMIRIAPVQMPITNVLDPDTSPLLNTTVLGMLPTILSLSILVRFLKKRLFWSCLFASCFMKHHLHTKRKLFVHTHGSNIVVEAMNLFDRVVDTGEPEPQTFVELSTQGRDTKTSSLTLLWVLLRYLPLGKTYALGIWQLAVWQVMPVGKTECQIHHPKSKVATAILFLLWGLSIGDRGIKYKVPPKSLFETNLSNSTLNKYLILYSFFCFPYFK